jgi:hypothetical protein
VIIAPSFDDATLSASVSRSNRRCRLLEVDEVARVRQRDGAGTERFGAEALVLTDIDGPLHTEARWRGIR